MSDYFTDLERALVRAAGSEQQQPDPVGKNVPKRWMRRRTTLLAVGLVVLGGVPAAAVTGVFRPQREADGLVRLSRPTVLASGSTADGRTWEILGSESDAGFCLETRIGDAGTGGGCGGARPGSLSVGTISGGDDPHNAVAVGLAPTAAVEVRVRARGTTVNVPALEARTGLPTRVYFAEIPTKRSIGPTKVEALDQNGRVLAATSIG